MGLSKSRYTTFCQCPKALWLRTYKPDEAEVDEGLQARFEQGNKVGDLAMELFGAFKEVTSYKEDNSLDYQKMIELTKQYMNEDVENICEASFSFKGNYCAVDILHKTADGWAMYEVKSTSFPEFNEKPAKLDKYVPDIAYQKWVLMQCGVNVTGTYLVCLNSDYVRQGELDIVRLFVIKNMGEMVEVEIQKVPARVSQAMKVLDSADEPERDLGEQCNKPYHCSFWEYCSAHLPKPSVFDVYGGSFKSKAEDRFFMTKKLALYKAGKCSFDDIKDEPLGHIQRMQVEANLTGKEFINRDGIRKFLDTLSYPLYFLDYETMQDAIPEYDGAKPYQQITFQFSLHVKDSENSPYRHFDYLAPNDGSDPRRGVAEALCDRIPKDVCVLAFNKDFEVTRTKELAAFCPDLADHLLNIANHIVDLIDPFRAGNYYVPAMGGSFSIKSVLPALFPKEPSLDYHNLSDLCQNGGDAMTIFPQMTEKHKQLSLMKQPEKLAAQKEIDAAREALLRYCELDTWAMVKVWEKLKEVAE